MPYNAQRNEMIKEVAMKERIKHALQTIMQNKGDDWFIIIEEPEQEKFVQFAFDEGEGLIFDLPFQALNKTELAKARKLMAEFSITPEAQPAFDQHSGKEIGKQESFNAQVGGDLELAINLSYRVFVEVYGLVDTTPLNVTIMR